MQDNSLQINKYKHRLQQMVLYNQFIYKFSKKRFTVCTISKEAFKSYIFSSKNCG